MKFIKILILALFMQFIPASIGLAADGPEAKISDDYAQTILSLANQARVGLGLAPLALSDELTRAADIRAGELVRNFSHTRPDGSPFHTVLPKQRGTMGENAAAGSASPEEVFELWMDSPGHRRNILDARYRELGVGYCFDKNSEHKHYWIMIFRSGAAWE